MELKDAKRELEKVLNPIFESLGFARKSPLVWMRAGQSDYFILVGVRKDARGYFAVTASGGIRFGGVISGLLEGSPTNGIHVNVPFHLLEFGGKFEEWQFDDAVQLQAIGTSAASDVEMRALPFFECFGKPEEMRDRLRSRMPKDWFTLSGEQRIELLAAIEAGLGNQPEAIDLIDAELANLRDALPKKRYALEALRAKLAA